MPIEEKDLTKNKRWKNNERKENTTFKQEHKKTSIQKYIPKLQI